MMDMNDVIDDNDDNFFRPELEQKKHLFTQIVIQSTGDRICVIKTRTNTTENSPISQTVKAQ